MSSPSSDPYFQRLFAERIGGAQYGKGTDIYKFEKIKRAKRHALADHPERTLVDLALDNWGVLAELVVVMARYSDSVGDKDTLLLARFLPPRSGRLGARPPVRYESSSKKP